MTVEFNQATIGEEGEWPFLLVSHSVPVTCEKCGSMIPSPGRIAIKTDGAARYWCDCVTEEEMQEICAEWEQYAVLWATPDEDPQ